MLPVYYAFSLFSKAFGTLVRAQQVRFVGEGSCCILFFGGLRWDSSWLCGNALLACRGHLFIGVQFQTRWNEHGS